MGAPADGNEDGTRCQRRTTLGLTHSGKKWQKSASRKRLSLDNRGPHKGSLRLDLNAITRADRKKGSNLGYIYCKGPATDSKDAGSTLCRRGGLGRHAGEGHLRWA